MTVEEAKNNSETTEQVRQQILEFVKGAEFEKPEYQAVSDYCDIQGLYDSLRAEHRNILSSKEESAKLSWESQSRITEMKIALLEHEISQNKSRIKGYATAYTRITAGFDDLAGVVNAEADKKFPGDDQKQYGYTTNTYDEVFSTTQDTVFRKRE